MSNKIESAPLAYDQSHVEAEIAEINTLIGAGKLEEAASKCRFALETHQDARYFLLQGYVAQQSGDYELAIRASTRANELGHENWLGNFVLGFSLGALGRHDEARVALARAHTLAPGRIDPAVYLLEETAITEGNDAADALFRSMSAYIKDPSFDLAWHLQIIRRLLGQEMLHDAERECRQAIEKYDVAAPHAWLGYIAQQTGRHELAVQSCRRAIELGLQDWTTYFVLAGSLRTLKRHAEARDAAAKAYSLEPQRADSAILYLEETVAADGFADARELFQSMRTGSTDLAVTREWRRLTFENGDDSELEGLIVARQMTARSWAEANGQAVLSVESVEEIPIEAPPVIGAPQIHFKTTVMSNEPYVADLRDVTIFSKSHIVLTPDGVAVNDTGANARFGRYVSHRSDSAVIGQRAERLLIDPSPFELATLDAGVMMSGVVSDAFGHWVPEYLPKLQFLEHHPDFRDLPIVVDEVMPASHFEYLQLIVPNRIIKLPAGRGLRCKRLLYASPATF
jgi:tetratricopeptide (TPR) repeat protein